MFSQFILGLGYQVNGTNGRKSPPSRKMKSSLKIKTNPRLIGKTNAWSHAVDALSERKLRTAASTNNTELMYNLIAKGINIILFYIGILLPKLL